MTLSAPTKGLFIVAAVLFLLGMLGYFGVFAPAAPYAFKLVAASYVVLAIGNVAKGL